MIDHERCAALVESLAAKSEVRETACASGTMPFRLWAYEGKGDAPTVVLCHGGSGSWTHWIANIEPLTQRFTVVAPDLPGLGDAASLPDGCTAEDAAHWLGEGIAQVVDGRCHLVAFSWGCIPASIVAASGRVDLASLLLIGPAALGPMPKRPALEPLIRRTPDMTAAEVDDANRENLARLMIADRGRIDELAVYLQTLNTQRSRFNSPQFAGTRLVLDSLATLSVPTCIVYGELDATARPNIGYRREQLLAVRPDIRFEVHPGAGHWLQYEAAPEFNGLLSEWVMGNN